MQDSNRQLDLAIYYAHINQTEDALKYLREFSKQENFHYWTILFLKHDPQLDQLKKTSEFKKIYKEIEKRFWDSHRQLKASFAEQHLL